MQIRIWGHTKESIYVCKQELLKKESKVARYPIMYIECINEGIGKKKQTRSNSKSPGTLVKNSNDETKYTEFNKNLSKV